MGLFHVRKGPSGTAYVDALRGDRDVLVEGNINNTDYAENGINWSAVSYEWGSKNMKKYMIACLISLVCVMDAFAEEISLKAYWGLRQEELSNGKPTGRISYKTVLLIKNTGSKECLLPKANLGPSGFISPSKTFFRFSVLDNDPAPDGTKIKYSFYEFMPVRLMPNEGFIINHELVLRANDSIDNVTYIYEIPSWAAKEWGFTEVKLEAKLIKYDKSMNPDVAVAQPSVSGKKP